MISGSVLAGYTSRGQSLLWSLPLSGVGDSEDRERKLFGYRCPAAFIRCSQRFCLGGSEKICFLHDNN